MLYKQSVLYKVLFKCYLQFSDFAPGLEVLLKYSSFTPDRHKIVRRHAMFTAELCPWTHFNLAEIPVLAGGAIPPAPTVPACTGISARLKSVQEHRFLID